MKSPNQFLFLGLAALLVASVSAAQYRPQYPPPQPQNSFYCPEVKCPECRPTLTCGACQECQKCQKCPDVACQKCQTCQECQKCPKNTFTCPKNNLSLKCPDPAPVCCPGEHKDKKKRKCDNYVTKLKPPVGIQLPWDLTVSYPQQHDVKRILINQGVTATPAAPSTNGDKCWKLGCCAHSPLPIFALTNVRDPKGPSNRHMEVRYQESVRLCLVNNVFKIFVNGLPAESYKVNDAGFNPKTQNIATSDTDVENFGPGYVELPISCGQTRDPKPDYYYLYGACYASTNTINKIPYALPNFQFNTIC